eukprot:TRINITY_DN6974_c0_g1_i5.p1 TRINITY_DN6974_c0_g1~~TRINITY_DN6974_c0_g1_i5.p1  ORF type:complete len:209 (-),score=21.22 TRINITY_DN6974_c0_g1_i5:34-660(-)
MTDTEIEKIELVTSHQIEEQNLSPSQSQSRKWKLGNHIVLRYENNVPVITLGPHWYLFAITFTFMGFVSYVLISDVATHRGTLACVVSLTLGILAMAFYMITSLKNPGIVIVTPEAQAAARRNERNYCYTCGISKAENTYHCKMCNVCIEGFDHHCPWTGKCIGKGNLKAFYAFICFTFTHMIVAIFISSGLIPVSYTHLTLPTIYSV